MLSIIFAVSIAAAFLWLNGLSSVAGPTVYVVEINTKDVVVPVSVCNGRKYKPPGLHPLEVSFDGQADVSVSVKNADGIPLNYRYEVSGGRVVGQGPEIKWNLQDLATGEYSIKVEVDDGVGRSGQTKKTVRLIEAPVRCPCRCPALSVVSHFSQITSGETLDFEAWVHGGDFESEIKYNWTVEKGVILSGQGTPAIEVKAIGATDEKVTATIEIGGIGRDCMCSQVASESVKIGSETKTLTTPLAIQGMNVEGHYLYLDCPRGTTTHKLSRTSYDLIANVRVFAVSNSVLDKLTYKYTVTGGKVVGSGPDVNWDLTGYQGGVYGLTVEVSDGKTDPPIEKTATVTLANWLCVALCPEVELSEVQKIKDSDDVILSADVTPVPETTYVWSAQGAKIIAGQGTRMIRVRPEKADALVSLSMEPLNEPACPRVVTRRLVAH